jgi:hypothetical protein
VTNLGNAARSIFIAGHIMGLSSGPTEPTVQSRRHERVLGLLIWLAFAALGIGILWWFSPLSGD